MSTVRAELVPWVAALRGALEWHAEIGEAELEVPAGFEVPPIGEIEVIPPPPSARAPAVEPVEEAPAAPMAPASPLAPAPGPAPSPSMAASPSMASPFGPPPMAEAAETTFLDAPSLLEGPAEAALVFGWSGVRVAFVAGPLPEDASPELVKKVGALVSKMCSGMGLGLGEAFFGYLAGPGGARPAAPAARMAVRRQLAVARPDVVVALGDFAARTLCGSETSFKQTRGQWHSFEGVEVMPTFHPEALLQNPASQRLKAVVWDDLKSVMRKLGLKRGGG